MVAVFGCGGDRDREKRPQMGRIVSRLADVAVVTSDNPRWEQPEKIIEECRGLIAEGYKEITLLGQNVNSYGKDLGTDYDFADLLAAINAIPGDYWLRFMSSQPKDATNKLFDTMARCE